MSELFVPSISLVLTNNISLDCEDDENRVGSITFAEGSDWIGHWAGGPCSDHGDLRGRLDAIEGDASHMPMVLYGMLRYTGPSPTSNGMVWFRFASQACFQLLPSGTFLQQCARLSRMRASHMPALATSSTPKV